MPKCSEVAQALRDLAFRLEATPDEETSSPWLWWRFSSKEPFVRAVKLMPKPLAKKIFMEDSAYPDLHVTYESPSLEITATIPQSLTCTLIEPARPARYDCDPVLSLAEERELVP